MSTYLSNYQHDIFVSYVSEDNEPYADTGWVNALVARLKNKLGLKLATYSLCLPEPDNSEFIEKLQNSATLLLILSKTYLASPRCDELRTFLNQVGKSSGRIFVVERETIIDRPPEIQGLPIYQFWTMDAAGQLYGLMPSPEDQIYHQKVDDLTVQLVEKLKHMYNSSQQGGINVGDVGGDVNMQADGDIVAGNKIVQQTIIQADGSRATVFLAEVTDDLQEHRNTVKRYLEQQQIQVLPESLYFFAGANAAEQLQQAIETDLQKSAVFMQILSSSIPQRPPGMSTPQLQHGSALAIADLPILQWRDAKLDLTAITNPVLKDFLDATTVSTSSLEEFKLDIMRKLEGIEAQREADKRRAAKPNSSTVTGDINDNLIFINTTMEDQELGEEIGDLLDEHGLSYCLPLLEEDISPAEKRQDLEENLLDCDGIIMPYDPKLVKWLREQLRYCRRLQGKREQPLKSIGVFNTTDKKPSLGMKLPNMCVLDCTDLNDDVCLGSFIKTLTSGDS
ncbi:toll/interleukin-1 receptor domain-containing protein [Candidatus Halobeggiatoa sp. HSG11]|nr:toll/interleukin-1 receptor domain-containing protein [Candidatus Halobeggiatoa sp. HSG11]